MAENTEILLERFKAKKAEKDSASLQEARRFVNLYRSLSCFGNDFVDKYNEMLLVIKPNVRRLLSTFMGGKEVEDYLEFLEENVHLSVSETGESETGAKNPQNKGYLPEPEADVGMKNAEAGMISVSEAEWKQMQMQKENLIKQTQDLLNVVKKLEAKSASQENTINTLAPKASAFENYSEIVEDIPGGKVEDE